MTNLIDKTFKGLQIAKKTIIDANLPQKTRIAYQTAMKIKENLTTQSVKDRRLDAVYIDLRNQMTPDQYAIFRKNNSSLNLPE